ncbi:MAG: fluoride efflux transporter CrcB [Polynucleobacter sp.]|nr:fluoride efflux transporter CrcB [Polynucleobacter sp.]MDZ4056577.1 fluoride efflux transporter CrcB [Polynucleobacter sp.]
MWPSMIAIFCGAGCGALVRAGLNVLGHGIAFTIPLGTLFANWLGGYLVGIALAFFGNHATLAPEWRLLIITGFLGGLTTFSSFSAEVLEMLQRGELTWAIGTVFIHVLGSLALTFLGILTYQALK